MFTIYKFMFTFRENVRSNMIRCGLSTFEVNTTDIKKQQKSYELYLVLYGDTLKQQLG